MSFTAREVPIQTSETLQDLLPRLAKRGRHDAVVWLGAEGVARLSFAELEDQVMRLAGGLRATGAVPGERIAILAPNRPEWIVACLAIIASGAVVVPLDIRLGSDALAHELRDSGCARIFTVRERLGALRQALGEPIKPRLVFLDAAVDSDEGPSWHSLLGDRAADLPAPNPSDVAALFYTSGTTGPPKGVPLTHANLMSNLAALRDEGLATPAERSLLPLPLHHVYPFMVGMLLVLHGGATVVLPAGVSGPEIARALREARITSVIGVPRLYDALMAAIRRHTAARGGLAAWLFQRLLGVSLWVRRRTGLRLGRILLRPVHAALAPELRLLASGGAALDEATAVALEGMGWEVLSGYGLTETSPIVAFNPRGRARLGTVGKPLRGVQIRFEPVPDKPGGEILVRGPNLFSGYYNDPEATARAFTDDGWFRSGDLGELDADGYLKILARATETIVLAGGKNVFPEEVEDAYGSSPLVREVAVLEREGALAALVVPDADAIRAAGEPDVKNAVRRELRRVSFELPAHQRMSAYALTDQPLPRTTLGKLRRFELPALYEAASARQAAAPEEAGAPLPADDIRLFEAEPARRVWAVLERRYPDKPLSLDANPQVDLGIDSLEWVALTLELQEEHGLRLDEEAIARIATVRDLLKEATKGATERAAPAALGPEQVRWLEPPGPLLGMLGVLLWALNWIGLRVLFRLRIAGRTRLPARGPFVLAPNHTSFLDAFAVAAALPWPLIRVTYFGGITRYLFASGPRRLFSRIAHVFPIDPERSPASSLALSQQVLERNHVLIWFPEGARSPDGTLQPFMPGLAPLARRSRATFVPMYIEGTFAAWPKGRRLPRLRPVTVVFGEPLDHDALFPPGRESDEEAVATLRAKLLALAEAGTETKGRSSNSG